MGIVCTTTEASCGGGSRNTFVPP